MFALLVERVFSFADGRTVLAGPLDGNAPSFLRGHYELHRDGRLVCEVEVEGEMIPRTDGPWRAKRAVSVLEPSGLTPGPQPPGLRLVPRAGG